MLPTKTVRGRCGVHRSYSSLILMTVRILDVTVSLRKLKKTGWVVQGGCPSGGAYYFRSFVEKVDTPFREWDILVLRNYTYNGLKLQQRTFLCVMTPKTFDFWSDYGKDSSVRHASIILGDGTLEDVDVCGGRRNNEQSSLLSSEVVGDFGKSTRNFIHSADIE